MQKYSVGDIFSVYIKNRYLMAILKSYKPFEYKPYLVFFPSVGEIWMTEDEVDSMKLIVKSYLRMRWC